MRIAIVTENFLPKLDGVTRTLAMLLEHLRANGHHAIVLGPEGAPRRYAGYRVFGARGVPLPFYPELRALVPSYDFGSRLARFRPDVVHVADPMLLGASGIWWAQQAQTPLVSSYHTNLAAYCAHYHMGALQTPLWAYRRLLHNQCATTLCPSPSTAREIERRGFERVGIWPRGVDGALFRPDRRSQVWRERYAGNAARIVLYVGRLSHEKNLTALVEAFTALDRADTHLVLVGDGPARGDLARMLTGQRVTFTGYLQGEPLAVAYASSDVFVFPSLTETFGQVALEAMASGLPVVGFAAEGIRDLARDGVTGALAPVGAQGALNDAVRLLVEEPARARELGAGGRALAARHTWANVMDGLLATYATVIGARDRRRAA